MHQDGIFHITIVLFLLSGVIALVLDVEILRRDNLEKEKKLARLFGWLNVILGLLIFVGSWVYNTFVF
ncbi:CLC_0170 family protein [Halalkalibacter alkalisediminis]|uniref:CLC_0170 family protein n=1 Tax=Halalkalibacter alkalisediminis TaxID=935616 RepID=A0ABV6NIS5_9BACI|nr:CLC_0170 family protein [Halalkalibacter alkalisediminis]